MRPADLCHRVGLELHPDVRSINIEYAMHLPSDVALRFGHACNLTPAEMEGLTLTRWENLFGVGNSRAAHTWYGSGWLSLDPPAGCGSPVGRDRRMPL